MINLKPQSQNRQSKIQLKDGRMRIVKRQIHSAEDLQKELNKYGDEVKNVYETCATFLDPIGLHGNINKGGYKPIMMDWMCFIDLDDSNKGQVKLVLDYFKGKDQYKLWKVIQTSKNSFHIYYHDLNKDFLKQHPYKRMEYLKKKRMLLEKDLIEHGVAIDKGLMYDPYRTTRLLGSKNGNKNNFIVKEITILESQKAMTKFHPEHLNQKKVRPRNRTSSKFTFFKFMSNIVYGTKKQYVPFIMLPEKCPYKQVIKKLQKTYGIGTIVVFDYGDSKGLLALKLVSKERLQKILINARAINLNQQLVYDHSWIRTSKQLEYSPSPKIIGVFEAESKGAYSKPHIEFLKSKGININEENLAGTQNKILLARKRIA